MIVLLLIGFIAVALAYLESCGRIKNGLLYGFIGLWIIYAIRDNFGTDFWNYYRNFYETARIKNIDTLVEGREVGWALLNYAFKDLGFYAFSATIGAIINYIVCHFVKNYVPKKWWALAVFIYVFNPNLYTLSFSMMRQFLAMSLFLFSWKYIKKENIIAVLLIMISAILIHTTAVVLLPFSLLAFAGKIKERVWLLMLCGFLFTFISLQHYIDSIYGLLGEQEMFSRIVAEHGNIEASSSFGVGFLLLNIPTLITIVLFFQRSFSKINSSDLMIMSVLGIFSTIGSLLGQINMLLIRVGLYFLIYTIGATPIVFCMFRNKLIRVACVFLFCLGTIYAFMMFFAEGSVYAPMYREYHTFF